MIVAKGIFQSIRYDGMGFDDPTVSLTTNDYLTHKGY